MKRFGQKKDVNNPHVSGSSEAGRFASKQGLTTIMFKSCLFPQTESAVVQRYVTLQKRVWSKISGLHTFQMPTPHFPLVELVAERLRVPK